MTIFMRRIMNENKYSCERRMRIKDDDNIAHSMNVDFFSLFLYYFHITQQQMYRAGIRSKNQKQKIWNKNAKEQGKS